MRRPILKEDIEIKEEKILIIDEHLQADTSVSSKESSNSKKRRSEDTETLEQTIKLPSETAKDEIIQEEEDPNRLENLISNDVIEWEIQNVNKRIQQFEQTNQAPPDDLIERRDALQLKLDMLQVQVSTGKLSQEEYFTQLKNQIALEKKIALTYKNTHKEWAIQALQRAKIMQKELEESVE